MSALHPMQRQLRAIDPVRRTGRVRKIMSSAIEADGPNVPLGTLCNVERRGGEAWFGAEVVHVDRESVILSPF
ncbi:MAG: FliI/YscN family ATPase, partial [Alphaproteobacteria bacterium]|nr:FliI/YscN family ATPase [Alphaproteobacteria bacterium]